MTAPTPDPSREVDREKLREEAIDAAVEATAQDVWLIAAMTNGTLAQMRERADTFGTALARKHISAALPILDRLTADADRAGYERGRREALEGSTRLAAALYLMIYDAHQVYGSTATWHGGIGGAAMTTGCAVKDPAPDQEWAQYDLPSTPLREWLEANPDVDLASAAETLKADLLSLLTDRP